MVHELDVAMLQMTEMLASLLSKKTTMKHDIQFKLSSAFEVLMSQAYPESGRFFLSKSAGEVDSTELSYQALRAISLFNENYPENKVLGLKKRQLIDYFMIKTVAASSSENLAQAVTSITAA